MHELISQLLRLYLPAPGAGAPLPEGLEQHLAGHATRAFDLASDGTVRAIVIPFDSQGNGEAQWELLCAVANALQGELGLPAPAVSVSGATGFRLWLSFERPVPVATAQRLLDLLCAAYCPDVAADVTAPVELPPCRQPATGKWAAFIHPGMGASFADEPALEMTPPAAAQAAFLQGLQSIGAEQLEQALAVLRTAQGDPASEPDRQPHRPVPPQPVTQAAGQGGTTPAARAPAGAVPDDLLLKDAALEDIVRFLHAKNIEPTFRHLLPAR